MKSSLIPKSPRSFLSFLEFVQKSNKMLSFDKYYQFKKILTIQIQTRHDMDHMREEKTTI